MKSFKHIVKIALLSLSFLTATVASAQVKVDVIASPQINENISFRIGSDLNVPINSRWSFVPGLYWSLRNRQSTDNLNNNGTIKESEYSDYAHFVTLPLRLGIQFPLKNEDKLSIKLLFGPYLAYGICGTSKTTIKSDDGTLFKRVGAFDSDGRYKYRLDYGLSYGLNFQIKKHYLVGIFNEVGLRKIYRMNDSFEEIIGELFFTNKINFALGLTFGYQF